MGSLDVHPIAKTELPSEATTNSCSVHWPAPRLTGHGVLDTDAPHVTSAILLPGSNHFTLNTAPGVLLFTVTLVTGVDAVTVISNNVGLLTLWSDRLSTGAAAVPVMPAEFVAVEPV